MAGKHQGFLGNGTFTNPGINLPIATQSHPNFPGDRIDKAYAEGRLAGIAQAVTTPTGNPHPTGTEENRAWFNGGFYYVSALAKLQTGSSA